jgi:hypothetical protein
MQTADSAARKLSSFFQGGAALEVVVFACFALSPESGVI